MIPDALWMHPDLLPIDSVLWCALCQHARDRPDVVSTNQSLAAALKVSDRTVKRSLSRLVAVGFVQSEGETSKRVLHLCPDAVEPIYSLRLVAC